MAATASAASSPTSSGLSWWARSIIVPRTPTIVSARSFGTAMALSLPGRGCRTVGWMEPVVVHVSVEGDGRGTLTVTWELDGDGPVEVAVGPTPETVAHGSPAAIVDGEHQVVL